MVDPAVPNQTPQNVPNPDNPPVKIQVSKKKVYIATGIVGGILLVVLIFFLLPQGLKKQIGIAGTNPFSNSTESSPKTNTTSGEKPATAIAKVGDEYIYQKDLDIEIANYPMPVDEKVKKMLLDKLIKDSIILQAAKKENLIKKLDQTFYNSSDKNYAKRYAAIQTIEENLNNNVDQISGNIISVWFYNMVPAKIGLEKGKAEAFKKISALQKRVATKEITLEEAANMIRTDTTYENLDFSYQNNALVPFSNEKGERITFDEGFDKLLWNTKVGDITPVYLGQVTNGFTNKRGEAFYAFGQITDKKNTGKTADVASWYDKQKENYESIYY